MKVGDWVLIDDHNSMHDYGLNGSLGRIVEIDDMQELSTGMIDWDAETIYRVKLPKYDYPFGYYKEDLILITEEDAMMHRLKG